MSFTVVLLEKPDLTRMWETFIEIPIQNSFASSGLYSFVRQKIGKMVARLINSNAVGWYCFLIHDRDSGVPTTPDDCSLYFHVRVSLAKGVDPEVFQALLPNYCVMTRKIEGGLESIAGVEKSIIANGDIGEAWRIIGEQSEWFLCLLNTHKEDSAIPPQQVAQFLHFFANMAMIQVA